MYRAIQFEYSDKEDWQIQYRLLEIRGYFQRILRGFVNLTGNKTQEGCHFVFQENVFCYKQSSNLLLLEDKHHKLWDVMKPWSEMDHFVIDF